MTPPRSLGRLLAALAALMLAVAACGVPEDGQPRAVGEDEEVYRFLLGEAAGTTTTTDAPAPSELGPGSVFWAVGAEEEGTTRIEEVEIEVNVDRPTRSALDALFDGPTEEEKENGYGTRIPEDLELVDVRQGAEENVVVVGLVSTIEGGIEALTGERLQLILAQIVYTATASGQYDSVRFTEDNESLSVPNQEGTASEVVTRDDYSMVASPPDPDPTTSTTGSTTTIP
ncbi:MAG: GerMN domain-containing protein [Actinomycetia bacterium]|nr:GerMN domain-containing protein [Actinomycetes bacterium]